jgi:hypothetical protein
MIATMKLAIADRVRLSKGGREKNWWTVRATDNRFVILTRQAPFEPKGTVEYTIIDWERGVRGPTDLLGQGWDFETEGVDTGAKRLLRALNNHLDTCSRSQAGETSCQVSYRNNVPIEIFLLPPVAQAITDRKHRP